MVLTFNSRARRGRDPTSKNSSVSAFVSIHAPAGGATSVCRFFMSIHGFQFTRPQGARRTYSRRCWVSTCFNSRARRGRDRWSCSQTHLRGGVSIHAPAGGATFVHHVYVTDTDSFNSRARRGRDLPNGLLIRLTDCFNSRARRGRDWSL